MQTETKRRKVRKRLAAVAVAALLFVEAIWLLLPSARLVNQATFVADVLKWNKEFPFYPGLDPVWDTDHSLIFDRNLNPRHPLWDSPNVWSTFRYDLRTHGLSPIVQLDRNRGGMDRIYLKTPHSDGARAASPDGRWLAISYTHDGCLLAEVDGSRHVLIEPDGGDFDKLFWTTDGRYCVGIHAQYSSGSSRGAILSPGRRREPQTLYFPESSPLTDAMLEIAAVPSLDNAVAVEPDYMVAPDGTRSETATIHHIKLVSTPVITRSQTVGLPTPCFVDHVSVSLQGDRIAWLLSVPVSSKMNSLLHRWFPFVRERTGDEYQLWVSNGEGENMRFLGRSPFPNDKEEDQIYHRAEIYDLTWVPGGKKLSFIVGGKLYTIDAD
jgi:hypothetical protein